MKQDWETAERVVIWFSCGAASAVAAKLALAKRPDAELVYIYVAEEHPDNQRFRVEAEAWLGKPSTVLRNENRGASVLRVIREDGYLVGPRGARCTLRLKKQVREKFQRPGDLHVFGYTAEEQQRADRFIDANADIRLWCPLIDAGLQKSDCLELVRRAGIELPAMYRLGYSNANCIGCVKGGAGYWNKIRRDFPERFAEMSALEEELGRTVLRRGGKPLPLRELPENSGNPLMDMPSSCGIACEFTEVREAMAIRGAG